MQKKTERGAEAPQVKDIKVPADIQSVCIRPLNTLCDEWSEFDPNYVIGDDGNIYRRLKSGYYRSGKKHPYQQVRNSYGTKSQHTVHLHKAVALAFLPRDENCTDVDHIDNDKTNNCAANLQWLTHRDNIRKMFTDRRSK